MSKGFKTGLMKGMGQDSTMKGEHHFNPDLLRLLRYLEFKLLCAAYQFENPVRLDMDLAVRCRDELLKQQEEKVLQLQEVMPKMPSKVSKANPPKITHKKDGTPSKKFLEWQQLLRERKLPATHKDTIETVLEWQDGNPNSTDQVKSWLYSLGWKPCTFKFVKNKETGEERQIEQVRKDGELTSSVLRLKETTPEVEILEGLTIIQHRLGVFQGFIDSAMLKPCDSCDGTGDWFTDRGQSWEPCPKCRGKKGKYYLRAEIGGLTNTLRFKHKKPLVNLPGVDKPWGEEVRSCLIAEGGEKFVGADLSSLEATTKAHYIYPHDPDYAIDLTKPEFDEHLDLAVIKGEITRDQYIFYTTEKDEDNSDWKGLHKVRKAYKPVNYGGIYGIGATKLARETGWSVKVAKDMLAGYWERNWAVKKIAEEQFTKEVGGYVWLKNPVSGFWYELRYDKDRFSTLNQSTGVYIFDSWLARARLYGYMGQGQFHDETLASVPNESQTREQLKHAIEKLNQDLKLNVAFAIDVKSGANYKDVH
jgi:hypothetical protein